MSEEEDPLVIFQDYAKVLPIDDAGAQVDATGQSLIKGFALSNDMETVSLLLTYAANLTTQGWDEDGILMALHQRGINPPIALTAARELQSFARRVVSRSRAVPTHVPGSPDP